MCMGNKYLVNREDLGKRTIGYIVYNDNSKDFSGMTEKQVMESMKSGTPVYGFVLGKEGSLQLDSAGFHTSNYMVKTGINTLTPAFDHDGMANIFYVVVGSHTDEKSQTLYEVVNSRYGRTEITEQKLKVLLEIGAIQGGVYLDHKNKLVLCNQKPSAQGEKAAT